MNLKDKNILITGASGFLGTSLVRELEIRGIKKLYTPSHKDFDLTIRENCAEVVKNMDVVIHLAAKVGGIGYNIEKPGELFYDNLIMCTQLMEEARKGGVEKFVAIGTVCAYPKFTSVPFKEEDLWEGYPEETNAPYGLAKKMMLVQGQAYRRQYDFNSIYLLPVNLYGPNDNFDPKSSHVIPALIKKFIENKNQVVIWGSGNASREFLYVNDAAEGICLATEKYDKPEPINLGSGKEIQIRDLAIIIAEETDFLGDIIWDNSKPDGQPRRCLDISKAKREFGFEAKVDFREGIKRTVGWYLENYSNKN